MNKRQRKKNKVMRVKDIGWEEVVDLDDTLSKLIYPRLLAFKKYNIHSYPGDFNTFEEWQEVIDKIIYAFKLLYFGVPWVEFEYYKGYSQQEYVKEEEKIKEGLLLFAKYYRDLWD